jgi:tetratricopeptide (TPR) repeat protein
MNRKKIVVLILIGVIAVLAVGVPVWLLFRSQQDPTPLVNEADQWIAKKEYERAVNLLQEALQNGGNTRADVFLRLGDCYSQQRAPDVGQAVKYYQKARNLAPANPAYGRKYARALLAVHQYPQAYVEAKDLTKAAGVTAEDYRLLVLTLQYIYATTPREDLKKQYYQEALAAAQKAVELGPTELLNYATLESLLMQGTAADQVKKAEAALVTATQKVDKKDQGNAYLSLADFYLARANLAEKKPEHDALLAKAEKTLQEGRKEDPDNAAFPLSMGRLAEMRGKTAAAEAFFDDAIKMAPSRGDGYLMKANALMTRKDTAAARATIDLALKNGSPVDQLDSPQKFVRAELLLMSADLQMNAGQLEEAGRAVAQAEALSLNRPEMVPRIPLERGRIALFGKKYSDAVNELAKAVDRQVDYAARFEKLGTAEGNLLARQQHEVEARYRLLLGAAYEALGVPGSARTEFEKVSGLLPRGETELRQQANEALMRILARMNDPEARKLADLASPNDYLAQIIRANDALRSGHADEAIRLGTRARDLAPERSSAYLVLARAYVEGKKTAPAEQTLLDGLAKCQDQKERQPLYVELGRLYAADQSKLAGLIAQIQADKELTDDQKLFLRVSLAPDNEQRRAIFEEELKKDANNPTRVAGLATTLLRLGRTDEALKYYRDAYGLAIEKKNDDLQHAIWDQVWMILLDGDKFAEAQQWIDRLSPAMTDERQAAAGLLELSKAKALPPEESKGQGPEQLAALEAGHVDKAILLFKALLEKHKGAVADVRYLRPLGRAYVLKSSLPLQDQKAALDEAESYYQKVLAELPQDVQARLGLGNVYLVQGKATQALTQASEILRADPANAAALALKAVTQEASGDYAEAAKTRETLRRAAPQDVNNLLQLGRLYAETPLNNPGAAETAYREAVKLSPQSPELVYNLAVLLYSHGPDHAAEADGLIEKLMADKPKDPDMLRIAAQYYQRTNRQDRANHLARDSLALQPDKAFAAVFLSRILEEEGQIDEAIGALEEFVAKNPKATDVQAAKAGLAEALVTRGRSEDLTRADKVLREILAVNPELPRIQIMLDRIIVQEARELSRNGRDKDAAQQLAQAEEQLRAVLTRYPSLSDAWLALAEVSLARDDRTQAIERLMKISPSDGNFLLALQRRAEINRAKGNIDQYRSDLQQLLTLRPGNVSIRLMLAEFYLNSHRYDQAEATLTEGLNYQGDNVNLLNYYAQTELVRGKGAEALRAVVKATQLDPDNPGSWGLWARIMTAAGKGAEAIDKLHALAAAHDKAEWRQRLAFHLQLATLLNTEKRFDESKADLAALIKEHPDAALYVLYADTLLATSEAANAGRPDKAAAEAARKVLQEGLDKLGRKPELLNAVILVDMRAADWPRMEAAAADLLKDDPRNSTAMDFRSNALLNQGKYDSAFEWAQKAVDRDGMRFDAMNNMAWILAEKKKDPTKARPLIDQALKIAPWHPSLLDTSGWIQCLLGDYRQAIDVLEDSVKAGDSGMARYHLGLAYKLKAAKTINAAEKKKALQAAKENLQQAVALGEKNPAPEEYLAPAREALKNLQR